MKSTKSTPRSILPGILIGLALQGSLILGMYLKPVAQPPVNIYQYPARSLEMTVTAYTGRIRETNKDPGNTATMERPVAGWTCAVSRDLIHWLGGRVYIEGIGVRRVNDLMNPRFERSLDLFIGTVEEAREFGEKQKLVIYLGK